LNLSSSGWYARRLYSTTYADFILIGFQVATARLHHKLWGSSEVLPENVPNIGPKYKRLQPGFKYNH
jgi:hypothetical protein